VCCCLGNGFGYVGGVWPVPLTPDVSVYSIVCV
jgi:hypothetical protein